MTIAVDLGRKATKLTNLVVCPRKFMVVNLLKGIEKVSVLRQGWSILKDTNSLTS